jgi:hypothetical protein
MNNYQQAAGFDLPENRFGMNASLDTNLDIDPKNSEILKDMEAYNKEWMETNKTPDEKIEVIRRGSQHPHYIGIFVGTERIETKRFGNIFTSVEERPHSGEFVYDTDGNCYKIKSVALKPLQEGGVVFVYSLAQLTLVTQN